jgi:hypothetical protein
MKAIVYALAPFEPVFLVATIALLVLLAVMNLLSGQQAVWPRRLRRAIGMLIHPLLLVFLVDVIRRISEQST